MFTLFTLLHIITQINPTTSLNDTLCPDDTILEWIYDTSHTGLRPDCPSANIWQGGNTDYMFNSITAVQEACEVHPTCNFFQRFKGGGPNEEDCDTCFAHNYAHSCPDLDNIQWTNETRWGDGASSANNYQLDCIEELDINTTEPTINPTAAPITPRICPDETPLYWRYDTSHTGKRPNCAPVNIWNDGGYMWHSISVVKGACAAHPTCNFIQRYDGGGEDKENCDDCYGHNYVHYCPDLKNITWTTETRWGIGANTANNYQLGCDGDFGDISGNEEEEDEEGIPGWAGPLIVIGIVGVICCVICYFCQYGDYATVSVKESQKEETSGKTSGNNKGGEGETFVMT